jgi:AcrR family transcriptional regulator
MAYTVSKTINGRVYLYRVERQRDPQSGKSRNRWTYLGRAAGPGASPGQPPARRGATRLRLIEATERLLEGGDSVAVTPSAIAAEAGVAHGTFYRHFRDRTAVLEALVAHIRATRGSFEEGLVDDVASAAEARAALRLWLARKLAAVRERPDFIRGFYRLVASDAKLAAFRDERRSTILARVRDHLIALVERGFAQVDDPAATARILYTVYDGIYRQRVFDATPLDDALVRAAQDAVERIVFGATHAASPACDA